jgi:hypothetical protein
LGLLYDLDRDLAGRMGANRIPIGVRYLVDRERMALKVVAGAEHL